MKSQILFVDDDPQVLNLWRLMLRSQQGEWDVVFAPGGAEALALMETRTFDAIVTDLRMPGMDGAAFLQEAQKRQPGTARFIFSGNTTGESGARCAEQAHQFFAKPRDAASIKPTLVRILALAGRVGNPAVARLVAATPNLPSLPESYRQLVAELRSASCSPETLGRIVASDGAMTAKMLQMVNSAFFGLAQPVSSAAQAVALLGSETVKTLVLAAHVFAPGSGFEESGLSMEKLAWHSLRVGGLARRIAEFEDCDYQARDCAFAGGILHDIGKLILARHDPSGYRRVVEAARAERIAQWEAESRDFGANHAQTGAYLLGLWGLPGEVVDCVALHHAPGTDSAGSFGGLAAVHVANVLRHEGEHPGEGLVCGIDMDYLEKLGVSDRLDEWRKCAGQKPEGAAGRSATSAHIR